MKTLRDMPILFCSLVPKVNACSLVELHPTKKGQSWPTPHSAMPVFSSVEYSLPATILRTLLIRAGIETNPGPKTRLNNRLNNKWPCGICSKDATRSSVKCSGCKLWIHYRPCSRLLKWEDYSQYAYRCPKCSSPDTPLPRLKNSISILQWNANGLRSKLSELAMICKRYDIDVIAIQEAKLGDKDCPNLPGYSGYQVNRKENRGGGLVTYVKDSISHNLERRSNGQTLEELSISMDSPEGRLLVNNIYLPPRSSCPNNYSPGWDQLLEDTNERRILVGDFNSHHSLWYSSTQDTRGEALADAIEDSPYIVMNEDSYTRRPTTGNASSPDITLATSNIASSNRLWKPLVHLGSDHLPILSVFGRTLVEERPKKQCYINYKRADWTTFNRLLS